MRTQHIFVPALDVGGLLPFAVRKTESIQKSFAEQDRAKKELVRFIDALERRLGQKIFYMGFDVIGEKEYERFIFDKGGFLEVMTESPVAINAHFVHPAQAKEFAAALKATLKSMLPESPVSRLFLESIEVQDQDDSSLTVEKWDRMKDV